MMTSNYTRLQFSACKILDINSVFGTECFWQTVFDQFLCRY